MKQPYNPVSLEGKTALITGGSRGIGRATALLFARMGADIGLNYKSNRAAAEEVAAEITGMGRGAVLFEADVAERAAVARMAAQARTEFGGLDILVNNAGVSLTNDIFGLTQETWHTVIETNLTGLFNMCQEFIPLMQERGGASIINLSSIAGRRGSMFGDVHYAAAKAGVIGFTQTLARTLARWKIRVNAVAPGVTVSDMLAENTTEHIDFTVHNTPLGRSATVDEVAGVCLFLASSLSGFMTGTTLDVNGGNYMT
jgi:3-oxoacyl-[acyl-carrier protein] reductase